MIRSGRTRAGRCRDRRPRCGRTSRPSTGLAADATGDAAARRVAVVLPHLEEGAILQAVAGDAVEVEEETGVFLERVVRQLGVDRDWRGAGGRRHRGGVAAAIRASLHVKVHAGVDAHRDGARTGGRRRGQRERNGGRHDDGGRRDLGVRRSQRPTQQGRTGQQELTHSILLESPEFRRMTSAPPRLPMKPGRDVRPSPPTGGSSQT